MNKPLQSIQARSQIARPLKVLIPLIKEEIEQGDAAGHEHYRRAGQMLIEAKEQIAYGGWGKWLTKNFALSQQTASVYMRWAKHHNQITSGASKLEPFTSLRDMTGDAERAREQRQDKREQAFRKTLRDIAKDDFAQERQAQDEEIRLHRELAEELVDLGFRALATKLHPDRGGTTVAMQRLKRVRDELKQVAQTRRFLS
jgi:hypothetical protein